MDKKPDEFTATILDFGRITLPAEIRSVWKLNKGDIVTVKILVVNKAEKEA